MNACGPVKQVEAEHLQVTPSRRASCSLQWRRPFCFCHNSRTRVNVSVVEPEPRSQIKLPSGAGAGAETTNCGSGSFVFTTGLKIFIEKNQGY